VGCGRMGRSGFGRGVARLGRSLKLNWSMPEMKTWLHSAELEMPSTTIQQPGTRMGAWRAVGTVSRRRWRAKRVRSERGLVHLACLFFLSPITFPALSKAVCEREAG
jgi:hypothetical protein